MGYVWWHPQCQTSELTTSGVLQVHRTHHLDFGIPLRIRFCLEFCTGRVNTIGQKSVNSRFVDVKTLKWEMDRIRQICDLGLSVGWKKRTDEYSLSTSYELWCLHMHLSVSRFNNVYKKKKTRFTSVVSKSFSVMSVTCQISLSSEVTSTSSVSSSLRDPPQEWHLRWLSPDSPVCPPLLDEEPPLALPFFHTPDPTQWL